MPRTETEMLWHVKGEFSQSPPMWKQIRNTQERTLFMATAPKTTTKPAGTPVETGVSGSELWKLADTLRGNIDAAEYKHIVLPLMFLKYISDAFEELHQELESKADEGYDPEQPDEYAERNVFWVPMEARWSNIQSKARQEDIGATIDRAMDVIERENKPLQGVLPKNYGRDDLDKQVVGQVVDLVSNIKVGGAQAQATDVLGQVYEYFLEQFAIAEGRKGGEFYTPRSVVRLLVEMIEPYEGRVFDPCCGSAGMFVQSVKFIEAHATGNGNGKKALSNLSIYGQESNQTTLRLAKMNLAIRGIDAQIEFGDSFRNDQHPDLRADYILANPPFNISEWNGDQLREDKRWVHGTPPVGNANFAWMQHFLHHLAPRGIAGFVLANGSMSSNTSGEGEIRKNIVEADLVDCIIALPGQLFRSTQIPACLWFLSKRPEPAGELGQAGGDPVHRRPEDGPHAEPYLQGPIGRGCRENCRHIPRLAGRRGVRRRTRVLQERNAGGDPETRTCPDPRAICRGGPTGRRRGTLPREDVSAHQPSGESNRQRHSGWTQKLLPT